MKMPHVLKKIRRWLESWHVGPLRHLSRSMYWLRAHTYNRYHTIDIRNRRNGYAWGWMDRSEGILFANMAILVAFIEKEKAFDCHVDWRSAAEMAAAGEKSDGGDANRDAHAAAKKEMLEIYQWWTQDRKIAHDRYDDLLSRAYAKPFDFEKKKDGMFRMREPPLTEEEKGLRAQCEPMEEALEAKDREMMIRTIEIRGYMWT